MPGVAERYIVAPDMSSPLDFWPVKAACFFFLLASCARHSPPAATSQSLDSLRQRQPAPTAQELTRAPGHLEIGAVRLSQNGKPQLIMRADGTVEMPNEQRVAGKLEHNGHFVDSQGKLIVELTEEGEVVLANGDYLPVTIDREGGVHLLKEGRVVRLRADGTLEGANPAGPVVTIEGAKPNTRRAAMFLLVLAAFPVRQKT